MAHQIDFSNDRANIAFVGSRNDIWHRLGTEKKPGASTQSWITDAGLNWTAVKVPAIADLSGPEFTVSQRHPAVENAHFIARTDTGAILGTQTVSDQYQPVQPAELFDWFDRYIGVDDRFQMDVAGSLRGGATIWATATFNGGLDIAGDKHVARLLMTTTFDGTGSTINQGTMTRVVCANTLAVGTADKRAVIRTRHSTRFDAAKVGRELAAVAQGFTVYKAMGDAMAQTEMAVEDVSAFFKAVLDIDPQAKRDEISTRKSGQFSDLSRAFNITMKERNSSKPDVWAALQAVTRYVDHDRSVRDTQGNALEARCLSAEFGSGAALKAKAMDLLLPRFKDRVLIAA